MCMKSAKALGTAQWRENSWQCLFSCASRTALGQHFCLLQSINQVCAGKMVFRIALHMLNIEMLCLYYVILFGQGCFCFWVRAFLLLVQKQEFCWYFCEVP